ncbi:peptidase M16 [Bacteroidia bacterium]|nr:peptidase M16 [Bacteroidia bacterium]
MSHKLLMPSRSLMSPKSLKQSFPQFPLPAGYQTHILTNGLKIIHQYANSAAAHCGLTIGVGSRDEQQGENGMSHFIEHVLFKGTQKRKAFHVLSRLEDVGGELNAYTTKEDTCIYASFLPKDYERAIELFSDIVFHSEFPEKEIVKEKEVVIDEINSYKDTPSELIFDDFEELIFENDAIGRNILGDEAVVRSFTREQVLNFVRVHYKPQQMVISSIGNIDFEKLVRLVERYFGNVSRSGDLSLPNKGETVWGGEKRASFCRQPPKLYIPRNKRVTMETHQTHCAMGSRAYGFDDDRRIPLSLLTELLGGSGMTSRLNLNIREKHGLVYNIEAGCNSYTDTGVFTIYFGCDATNLQRCMRLCKNELKSLYVKPLGNGQLKKLKAQTLARMALSLENYENMMLTIGKSFIVFDKVDSIKELVQKVEDIDAKLLQEIAAEIFDVERLSVLVFE